MGRKRPRRIWSMMPCHRELLSTEYSGVHESGSTSLSSSVPIPSACGSPTAPRSPLDHQPVSQCGSQGVVSQSPHRGIVHSDSPCRFRCMLAVPHLLLRHSLSRLWTTRCPFVAAAAKALPYHNFLAATLSAPGALRAIAFSRTWHRRQPTPGERRTHTTLHSSRRVTRARPLVSTRLTHPPHRK